MSIIGDTIVKHAASWVTPEWLPQHVCLETSDNSGDCIGKLTSYFYNGIEKNVPYCAIAAWVWVDEACKELGIKNLLPKVAGSLDMLNKSKGKFIIDDKPASGAVFYRKSSAKNATGHMGLCSGVGDNEFYTIEGNGANFDYSNKKYQGIMSYAYANEVIDSKGFQFIHTEMMYAENQLPFMARIKENIVPILLIAGLAFYGVKKVIRK